GFGYQPPERCTCFLESRLSAFFADYVVLLDADEFLGAVDRGALLATLERIAPGGVGLMPWQTFVLTAAEAAAAADDPPQTIRQRRVAETPLFSKAVLRLDGTYRANLSIMQ